MIFARHSEEFSKKLFPFHKNRLQEVKKCDKLIVYRQNFAEKYICKQDRRVRNAMTENINFRTAVRGYNKEDVNRFILESDRLHRESESELQEKIQIISEERDELRLEIKSLQDEIAQKSALLSKSNEDLSNANAKIESLKQSVSSLEDEGTELKSKNAEYQTKNKQLEGDLLNESAKLAKAIEEAVTLKAQNDLLIKENEKQTNAYGDLQKAYNELNAAKEVLKEELEKTQNEFSALSEKQQTEIDESEFGQFMIEFESLKAEYARIQTENDTLRAQVAAISSSVVGDDAMQARLGEVILQANRTAEQIIHDANTTAKLIKMGAVEEATVIKKNFEDKMQQRAERAERLLKELSDKYFAAFEETKETLGKKVSEIIEEKKTELSQKTEAMQKETEASLLLTDAQAAALLN